MASIKPLQTSKHRATLGSLQQLSGNRESTEFPKEEEVDGGHIAKEEEGGGGHNAKLLLLSLP